MTFNAPDTNKIRKNRNKFLKILKFDKQVLKTCIFDLVKENHMLVHKIYKKRDQNMNSMPYNAKTQLKLNPCSIHA